MKIDRSITVEELKKSFVQIYPFLSLKVYRKFHDHYKGSPKSEEVEGTILLGDINTELKSGEITISDDLTVDHMETLFKDSFGLSVQIFRKSGDLWLQTTSTDNWTLEKQNRNAQEFDSFVKNA